MGAEGPLSGWRSTFLPLLSPLSLLQHMQIHQYTKACICKTEHAVIHTHTQVQYTVQEAHIKKFRCQHFTHICICDMQDIAIATGGKRCCCSQATGFSGTHALRDSQCSYDLSVTAYLILESYTLFYSKRQGEERKIRLWG